VFPTRFADEHFFFAADAFLPGGGLLVIGLEAAFAVGPPIPGDQIVFARIRIRIPGLANGKYRVRHPYGVNDFDVTAGEINFTEDLGIQCPPGSFDCALQGRIGPFLLPSNTPGGAELPPVAGPVPGKLYIADPVREGPVTGSPVGQNFFRLARVNADGTETTVEETSNFAMVGRLFTGAMSGKVNVDRASYASDASGNKLDVFATAFPTTQSRMPAGPNPPAVQPVVAFYPAACVVNTNGVLGPPDSTPVQMLNDGANYHGQSLPATVPAAVCVGDLTARDATGQAVPVFSEKAVTDQVTIAQAHFANGAFTVVAASSDTVNAPVLTALGYGDLPSPPFAIVAPPSKVRVSSSKGGQAELLVTTGVGDTGPTNIPLAKNDAYTVAEDSAATLLDVIANDTYDTLVVPVVTIVAPPQLGLASVSGTQISYQPRPNAFGNDSFAYTIAINGITSPAAFVSIGVTAINDAPTAVADTTAGVVNVNMSLNVLANDTDPDGALDLRSATIVGTSPGLTVVSNLNGVITAMATFPGQYWVDYLAVDSANASSAAAARATFNVTGNERITILRAEFIRNKLRWRVEGTSDLIAGQTITIAYDNGSLVGGLSLAGFVLGTAVVDATGAWALDTAVPAGAPWDPGAAGYVVRPNRIRATSPLGGRATAAFTLR
jgi:hypothetical protein